MEQKSSSNPQPTLIINATMSLAGSLWWENQGDDRVRSVQLLKGLITDGNLPPEVRSQAAVRLTANLQATYDDAFKKERVFTGELPFSDAISLMEFADDIFPNVLTKVMLAREYLEPVLDGKYTTEKERAEHISKAATLLSAVSGNGLPSVNAEVPPEDLFLRYDLYARYALASAAYEYLNHATDPFALSDIYYDKSAELIRASQDLGQVLSQYANSWLAFTDVTRAVFLVHQYGSARQSEIDIHLAEAISFPKSAFTQVFYDSIASLASHDKNSFAYKGVVKLAGSNAQFKKFLNDNGWSL